MSRGGEDVGAHGGALKLEACELHGQGDVADPAFHGLASQGDGSPRGEEEPGEDARERGFTGAVVAGDEHGLPGFEDEADVAQDGLLPRGAQVVGVCDAVGPQVLGVDEGGRAPDALAVGVEERGRGHSTGPTVPAGPTLQLACAPGGFR